VSEQLKRLVVCGESGLAYRLVTELVSEPRAGMTWATPTFAAAMLHRHVLTTIPVGRRVLLLGEVAVMPGSAWEGAAVDRLDQPELLRVLGVQRDGDVPLELPPPPGHRIVGGDPLMVIATRRGFAHATAQARADAPALES
jgi:hypothetical protein